MLESITVLHIYKHYAANKEASTTDDDIPVISIITLICFMHIKYPQNGKQEEIRATKKKRKRDAIWVCGRKRVREKQPKWCRDQARDNLDSLNKACVCVCVCVCVCGYPSVWSGFMLGKHATSLLQDTDVTLLGRTLVQSVSHLRPPDPPSKHQTEHRHKLNVCEHEQASVVCAHMRLYERLHRSSISEKGEKNSKWVTWLEMHFLWIPQKYSGK